MQNTIYLTHRDKDDDLDILQLYGNKENSKSKETNGLKWDQLALNNGRIIWMVFNGQSTIPGLLIVYLS